MKVSFGMGAPARIPWIAFTAPDIQVSKGFYPVYLYYKDFNTLILAYGISETEEFTTSWPTDVMDSKHTIRSFFNQDVHRYGDSLVFKAYSIKIETGSIKFISQEGEIISEKELESDLSMLLNYYTFAFDPQLHPLLTCMASLWMQAIHPETLFRPSPSP